MAGYRMRRRSTSATYVAINGSLTLPWAYSTSVDDYINQTGIFPEFFYNFNNTAGTVNIDVGLVFRGNNGWRVFANGVNVNNQGSTWYDTPIQLSPGQTVTIAAYTNGNNFILKVNNVEYIIPTKAGTANLIRNGCWVSREANLVPQKSTNLSQCWLLQTNAYFVGAVWSQTTMTTTNGVYATMNGTKTTFDTELDQEPTDLTCFDANCITHTSSTSNGYTTDNCTIDFRNRVMCR